MHRLLEQEPEHPLPQLAEQPEPQCPLHEPPAQELEQLLAQVPLQDLIHPPVQLDE